jgi:hypothetical protein
MCSFLVSGAQRNSVFVDEQLDDIIVAPDYSRVDSAKKYGWRESGLAPSINS